MKQLVFALILMGFLMSNSLFAQGRYKVYTEDITHFWEAYDSIQTTNNKDKQIDILQRLYVDRETAGLKDFYGS